MINDDNVILCEKKILFCWLYGQQRLRMQAYLGLCCQGSNVIPQCQKSHAFSCLQKINNNKNNCLYLYNIHIIWKLEELCNIHCDSHWIFSVQTWETKNWILCKTFWAVFERHQHWRHFLKFPLNLNCCVWGDRYLIFIKDIYFGHASFTFPIITEHQYFLYDVTQY